MRILMDAALAAELRHWLIQLDIRPSYDWGDVESRVEDCPWKNDVSISDGASKICLIFENTNFVIKWSTEDAGEAMQEVDYYQDAKKAGLAKFFPQTEYFFTYNGVDFVVQEKIQMSAGDVYGEKYTKYKNIGKTVPKEMIDKVQKDLNKVSGYTRHISPLWISCVLSLYGKKATKALCKFVQDHDINDLHGSNVGFLNDKPIILDFSGYHRED